MACARCAAFPKLSVHHERELETTPSLHRLSTTNFPATEQDASHIKNTILRSIEGDISSMTAKITALQATLQSMERERDALEAVQKQYRHIIHPHRALPPELWSEIFLLANDKVFDACDPSRPIWGLSQVCRPWRDIALSLHSLWSSIYVNLPSPEGHARLLELVLQRTGQCPLDVTLDNDDGAHRSSGVHSLSSLRDRVLGIIFPHSHRWRTLDIFEYPQNAGTRYAPLCDRLPRLESLYLYFSHNPTLVADAQPFNSAFGDCPRLTEVSLSGKLPPIDLPYGRITDLSIETEPLLHEDCLASIRLVGQCTSLKKLRVMGCGDSDPNSLSTPLIPPLVIHSNLQKLSTGCGHLIDHLTLPQLEEAVLCNNILPSFGRLLHRSHCTSLTNLNISDLRLADHLLVSVLSQIPSLTTLQLHAEMADYDTPRMQAMQEATEFIQALHNVAFLPHLSSVKIHLTAHMDSTRIPYFGPSGFSSMVKARWEGDAERGLAKLETFHLSLSAGLPGMPYHTALERLPRLRDEVEAHILSKLVDDGMDLGVRVTAILDHSSWDSTVMLTVGRYDINHFED